MHSLEKQKTICNLFISRYPYISGTAYEVLGVRFFSLRNSIMPFHFPTPSADMWSCEPFTSDLPIEDLPSSTLVGPHFTDVLWISPVDFPSIDAVAVTRGGRRTSMFQMAIVREHPVRPEGINKILRLFSRNAPEAKWEYLFVVPADSIGQKLCRKHKQFIVEDSADDDDSCFNGYPITISVGYVKAPFLDETESQILAVRSRLYFAEASSSLSDYRRNLKPHRE